MYRYTITSHEYTSYFASDLHHRLFHMPAIGEGVVEHYGKSSRLAFYGHIGISSLMCNASADGYKESLELAKNKPEEAVRISESLAFFALEVYAFDIAVPGEGCTGDLDSALEIEEDSSSAPSSSPSDATPAMTSTGPTVSSSVRWRDI